MTDTAHVHAAPDLKAIQALAAPDMTAMDALIRRRLASDVVLVNQVAEYIIGAGGKRLRPMLLLLAAGALGHHGSDAHQLAAVVEFIHTSTLLHDDVVDESDLRRGRSTANAIWGNAASVLVGDFLYSRSFQLMVELDRMPVMRILADTTNRIAEGEVLQLLHVRNPDTDEAAYLNVIERKTAVLFAAGTRLGALASGADEATQQALLGQDFSVTGAMITITTLVVVDIIFGLMKKYFSPVENILDGTPVILVENGVPLADKLKKVDVSCDDILVSARQNNGITKISDIKYAILERNGHISIIPFEK